MTTIFLTNSHFSQNSRSLLVLENGLQKQLLADKIDEKSIPLTAFSVPQGHYEWIVMSFGLKNAPQIFQRRMDNIFKNLNHCYLVYIDDILVFFKAIEQHKDDVMAITQTCIDHGIILGKNKCIYAE